MKKLIVLIAVLLLITIPMNGCTNKKISDNSKVELFLPQPGDMYFTIKKPRNKSYISETKLMDEPLLKSEDIINIDGNRFKTKKDFVIVDGHGLAGHSYNDGVERFLEFEYKDKQYKISTKSSQLFYNYYAHGVCVVVSEDTIFLVKQLEHKKPDPPENTTIQREYKKGAIGIPYVLVVDGVKTELGIIKVGEGEFCVPKLFDSWLYIGFPDYLPILTPQDNSLDKSE